MLVEIANLSFKKDKKDVKMNINDKNISEKLIKSMVIDKKQSFLPPKYSILRKRLSYNEKYEKNVELYLNLKVKAIINSLKSFISWYPASLKKSAI